MINLGIIGSNFITERLIAGAREVEGIKIVAVYSRSEERAKEFAEKFNIEYTFTDLEEMAKSDKINAVYIASPNAIHASQAKVFINNNKHVLCEKAFASNYKEGKEVIDLAREKGVVVMEAMKTTTFPNFLKVKENLYKIGRVRKYIGSYCQYSSRYDKYKEGVVLNAFKKELSNGAVMDIGVYTIAPMVNLFGKSKSVKASGMLLDTGVDGMGNALISYDGMEAVVNYSKISNSYMPSEIQGENGSIIIDRINEFNSVKIIYNDGREENLSGEQKSANMCYEVEEFVNTINSGLIESKMTPHEQTLETLKIIDEIRRQVGVIYPADL